MKTEYFVDFKEKSKSHTRDRDLWMNYRLSTDEFETLCFLYGNACVCCGRVQAHCYLLSVDHVSGDYRNVDIKDYQPVCNSCNAGKGRKKRDFRPDNGRCLKDFDSWVKFHKWLKLIQSQRIETFDPAENGNKNGLKYTDYETAFGANGFKGGVQLTFFDNGHA